jgi:tetratricopeptide (TPR) repeat protein
MFHNQVIPVTIVSASGGASRTSDNIKYHHTGDPHYPVDQHGNDFQVFDGSPTGIVEIADAYFVPGAMCLYDRNGVRIPESCIRRGKGLVEFVHAARETVSLPTEFVTVDEPLVYLSWLSDHWGDFLTEGTSRLWALLEYPELSRIPGFFLSTRALHSNMMDFIKSLSLNIRVGGYALDRCIRFRKLLIPAASFCNRGEAYSVHRKPATAVVDAHLRNNRPQGSEQPVFLSRSRAVSDRTIQHQAELENALAREGFLIVYPEELNLAEQIMLFNQHRHFYGCWGSAFHTAMLSRSPGSITTHIICYGIPNVNFLMVDSILGNDANYVRAMFFATGEQLWPHYNLTIDVELALSYYQGMTETNNRSMQLVSGMIFEKNDRGSSRTLWKQQSGSNLKSPIWENLVRIASAVGQTMETDKVAGANRVDSPPLKIGKPEFESALASAPANVAMLHSCAGAVLSNGRLDEARAIYLKILDHEKTNLRAMMALSRIDRRLGDHWSACERLRTAARLSPDNLQVLTELAAMLRDLDRPEEAASLYQQVLGRNPDQVQAHMGLGWIARARGDDNTALAHFTVAHEHLRGAAATDPVNLQILTQLAAALRGMNRSEDATAVYQQILLIEPKHVQSHMAMGWMARDDGDDEAALAHFKAGAESDPIDSQVQNSLGKLYLQMGRSEEAELIFRRIAKQAPNHTQTRASLGALARKKNDWSGAIEEFRAALESDPKNVPVRVELARTYCDLSRWQEAERIYQSIIDDSPRHVEALLGLATVAKVEGNLSAARALFEEASVAAPLDQRPKREIRKLKAADAFDWRTEIEEALAVTRAANVPVQTEIEAAKVLVEYGLTEAARPVLSRLEGRSPAARQLLLAVRQIERMGLARPLSTASAVSDPAEIQLESLQGFHEMPVPGSDTVLIVFGGTNNRLWMTFSLLHRILRKTGVSVIYCRDLQRLWYASGIIGLGHDFPSTVEGFRKLIAPYGATRVLTLGNCIGCLGALRYGLLLGAQGVLAISPKLRLLEDLEPHQRAQLRKIDERRPVQDKNIHREYLEVPSRPNVALIFGEDCAGDAYVASAMADVPGVALASIPESSDTDSVKDLLVRGLFEPLLQDFVANGAVSQKIHTLISTSRNPS